MIFLSSPDISSPDISFINFFTSRLSFINFFTSRLFHILIPSLLKTSKKFSNYNFRDYFYRHARDGFHKNKFETRPNKILEFIKKSEDELETLRRQSYLSNLYNSGEKLIIERGKYNDDDDNRLLKDKTGGEQF